MMHLVGMIEGNPSLWKTGEKKYYIIIYIFQIGHFYMIFSSNKWVPIFLKFFPTLNKENILIWGASP